MTEHWIWLASLPGLGPVKARGLLEFFGSAEALYEAGEAELRRAGVSPALRQTLADRDLTAPRQILRTCQQAGIRVLTPAEPDYPARLRQIHDAPAALYCLGSLPEMDSRPCIGLVGARKADARGLETARLLGWQIAGCGGLVVTGLAAGIDARSAEGALDRGGAVIGVLGCGVDVIYPRQNAGLYARVAARGCLLSEYPPGTGPNARHFPARNRLISALSDGVAVVQAAERSGALITARWAADQGRDVFAVPGPAGEPLSRGCNQLLREGAVLVESGWDVLSEYAYRYPAALREYHGRPPAREDAPVPAAPAKKPAAAPAAPARSAAESAPAQAVDLTALPPVQRRILEILEGGPTQLDALIAAAGLPAAQVLPQLTVLQIKHLISQEPGKIYRLSL